MKTEDQDYYYNPYLPKERKGKGEMMSLIKATLFLCMTILISVGAVTFSQYKTDRFHIVPYKDGVFIFDRQSTATNYCNDVKCVVVSSEFLLPKQVLVAEIPGVSIVAPAQQQRITASQRSRAQQQQNQPDLLAPSFQGSTMADNNPQFPGNMENNQGTAFGEVDAQGQFYNNENDPDQNYNNNNFN